MLQKVIIIARHGPREPSIDISTLPKFERNKKTSMITSKGKKYCQQFGSNIKNKTDGLVITNNDIYIASSYVQRTIDSSKEFMIGFDEELKYEVNIDNRLFGATSLDQRQKLYINTCKTISINDQQLNKQIYDVFRYKIQKSNDYFDLYTALNCYQFEGLYQPDELFNKIVSKAKMFYNKLFSNIELLKLFTDDVLELIISIVNDKTIKFAYLSTHDVVIFPLALRLIHTFTSYRQYVELPDFCSYVMYKIYDNKTDLYYNDKLIVSFNKN